MPVNRLAQLVHGACLPFHLLRSLWEDRALRRRYLTVSVLQAAAIVGLAVLFTGSGKQVVETVAPGEWSEEHREEVERELEKARAELEEAEAGMERLRKLQKVAEGSGRLAGMAGADPEAVRAAVEKALKEAQAAEDRRRAARDAAESESERVERLMQKRKVQWMVYWAALLSSLQIAQWIVIALSRDFHTVLEREVSLRTGVTPEDEPLTPRVRLNLGWVRSKMKRRWRALVWFGLGVPVLWVARMALPWGRELFTVLMSLWGAWWFVVFTAGKSARAWSEQNPREPWFLRGWNMLTSRLPVLSVYGSLWTRQTSEVFSPAASVERRPWGLMGLAVVRALAALPLVKCFLRPFIPVAAAHLLTGAEPAAPEGHPSSGGTPG
ncbi:hypothetical protein ATI61_101380 [Archangium gephyra]|uniref:Uncharacterized protein n=1 Tax=Archangium gephyra TaxID=48 RepID=A0ABX9KB80_9BACT|nr:hypothetical protein [Archangium gephyra]REG37396.1 hypothetical protein ATI61_101380 [Archangium gephyra]